MAVRVNLLNCARTLIFYTTDWPLPLNDLVLTRYSLSVVTTQMEGRSNDSRTT